jgi:hypothetical protein
MKLATTFEEQRYLDVGLKGQPFARSSCSQHGKKQP